MVAGWCSSPRFWRSEPRGGARPGWDILRTARSWFREASSWWRWWCRRGSPSSPCHQLLSHHHCLNFNFKFQSRTETFFLKKKQNKNAECRVFLTNKFTILTNKLTVPFSPKWGFTGFLLFSEKLIDSGIRNKFYISCSIFISIQINSSCIKSFKTKEDNEKGWYRTK